jgi:UPF0716 protein FxsA
LSLLLPGFITDAIGFILLIPPLRRALLTRWLKSRGTLQTVEVREGAEAERRPDRVIEGDYRRED